MKNAITEIEAWECPTCGELVKDGDICCVTQTIDAYQCEICDSIYEDRSEAEACCDEDEAP